MEVKYGPPGHKGVTQLMSVGAEDADPRAERVLRTAGLLSIGAWVAGVLTGSSTLKHVGLGAGIATFGSRMALRGRRAVPVETAPSDTGWWRGF